MIGEFVRSMGLDLITKLVNVILTLSLISMLSVTEYAELGLFLSSVTIISGGVVSALSKYELFFSRSKGLFVVALPLASLVWLALSIYYDFLYSVSLVVFLIPPLILIERRKLDWLRSGKASGYYKIESVRVFVLLCLFVAGSYFLERVSLSVYVYLYISTYYLVVILMMLLSDKELRVERGSLMELVRRHPYLFGYFFLITFGFQTDFMLLYYLGEEGNVAAYNASYRLYIIMISIVVVFQNILISNYISVKEGESIVEKDKMIATILFILVTSIAVSGFFYFDYFLEKKYPTSPIVLAILGVSCLFTVHFSPSVNEYLCRRDFKFPFYIARQAVVINFFLGVAFISLFQEIGAAIATLFSCLYLNCKIAALRANKT